MGQKKDIIEKRAEKIEELKKTGVELFPNNFRVSHTVKEIMDHIEAQLEENAGAAAELTDISAAGRVMAINKFGKSSFLRFRDRSGQLQAYVRQDKVGEDAYKLFKKLDIGD